MNRAAILGFMSGYTPWVGEWRENGSVTGWILLVPEWLLHDGTNNHVV